MSAISNPTLSATVLRLLRERKPPHVSRNGSPHAYASEAGACARQIGYRLEDSPCGTDGRESSLPAQIAFAIGDHLHEFVQRAFYELYPDAEFEKSWDLGYLSGRADVLYMRDGELTVAEIKSTAAGTFGKIVSSPYSHHLLQASISAVAMGAELAHIIYVNKSSRDDVPGLVEFVMPVDKYNIGVELNRLRNIVENVDNMRKLRASSEGLTDPTKNKYPCMYCQFRQRCLFEYMQEYGLTVAAALT